MEWRCRGHKKEVLNNMKDAEDFDIEKTGRSVRKIDSARVMK